MLPQLNRPSGTLPESTPLIAFQECASLELVEPGEKERLGNLLLSRLTHPELGRGPWAWALGRLGARVPVRGAAHCTVSQDVAGAWADALLSATDRKVDGAPFALAPVDNTYVSLIIIE